MPFLVPLLFGLSAFAVGAFTGAQVDDAIDQPPAGTPITQEVSPTKVILYGGAALLLLYGAQKTGIVKKFK